MVLRPYSGQLTAIETSRRCQTCQTPRRRCQTCQTSGFLRAVDDQALDWTGLRQQTQPELFLEGRERRRTDTECLRPRWPRVWRPRGVEIEMSGEPGSIPHGASHDRRQAVVRELLHRQPSRGQTSWSRCRTTAALGDGIRPPLGERPKVVTDRSISLASRMLTGITSTPSDGAAV